MRIFDHPSYSSSTSEMSIWPVVDWRGRNRQQARNRLRRETQIMNSEFDRVAVETRTDENWLLNLGQMGFTDQGGPTLLQAQSDASRREAQLMNYYGRPGTRANNWRNMVNFATDRQNDMARVFRNMTGGSLRAMRQLPLPRDIIDTQIVGRAAPRALPLGNLFFGMGVQNRNDRELERAARQALRQRSIPEDLIERNIMPRLGLPNRMPTNAALSNTQAGQSYYGSRPVPNRPRARRKGARIPRR